MFKPGDLVVWIKDKTRQEIIKDHGWDNEIGHGPFKVIAVKGEARRITIECIEPRFNKKQNDYHHSWFQLVNQPIDYLSITKDICGS